MVIFLFQIFSSFSLRPPLSSYRCLCVLAVNVCLSSSLQASASIKLLLHYFLLLKKCKSETSSFVPWWSAMFASAAAAQTHVFPATHVCVRRRKKYAAGGQQEKQTQIQIQVYNTQHKFKYTWVCLRVRSTHLRPVGKTIYKLVEGFLV